MTYVKFCITCAQVKRPRRGASTGLMPIHLPGGAMETDETAMEGDPQEDNPSVWVKEPTATFEVMGMDFVGPLPESRDRNWYVWVALCYATRWPILVPTKNQQAPTVAEILMTKVVLEYRVPRLIISDQGIHFVNEVIDDVIAHLGDNASFEQWFSSPDSRLGRKVQSDI